jgi:RNA polymerase sigma-70 factor (ECF subfamily)
MPNTNAYVGADGPLEIPGKEGITQAFEHILSRRLASFYRKAYGMLGNRADAEDAVQNAVLAAYAHLDQFKGQSEMSTWVTAIVHNCALLELRKRRRHAYVSLDEPRGEPEAVSRSEQLADHSPNPEDQCHHSELSTRFTHLYSQLSPTLSRAFLLRDIEGLSIRDTARVLRIPPGTVKARSARARQKLKKLMQSALRPRSRRLFKNQPGANAKPQCTNKNVLC